MSFWFIGLFAIRVTDLLSPLMGQAASALGSAHPWPPFVQTKSRSSAWT